MIGSKKGKIVWWKGEKGKSIKHCQNVKIPIFSIKETTWNPINWQSLKLLLLDLYSKVTNNFSNCMLETV